MPPLIHLKAKAKKMDKLSKKILKCLIIGNMERLRRIN